MAPSNSNKRARRLRRANSSDDDGNDNNNNEETGFLVVKLPERHNAFSKDSWWMVDTSRNTIVQGATPLVKRCMRNLHWTEAYARRVLKSYEHFLELKQQLQDWDAAQLSPCGTVDAMWHQHILDVKNYMYDCELLCGHMVWHNPDGAMDVQAKMQRDQTTRSALASRFGADYDKDLWLNRVQAETGGSANPGRARSSNNSSIVVPPQVASSNSDAEDKQSSDAEDERLDNKTTTDQPRAHSDELICIVVRDQTGSDTFFKIKRSTKMPRLFEAYARSMGVQCASLRFMLNGVKILPYDTPNSLGLDDLAQIDCMLEQTGC